MEKHVMTMPLQEEELRKLKIGDVVYLTGHIFTSRDMGHLRLRSLAAEGKPLPKDFTGAAIFHAGPVCLKNEDGSWRLNVIGPTTSIRMEPHADFVGQLGAKAIIGKGGMAVVFKAKCHRLRRQAGPGGQAGGGRHMVRTGDARGPVGPGSGGIRPPGGGDGHPSEQHLQKPEGSRLQKSG